MQNFAGEMQSPRTEASLQHTSGRDQGLELIVSFTAGSRLHGGALHHRRQCSNQSSVGRRVVIVRSFRERGALSCHHGPELVSRHIHIWLVIVAGPALPPTSQFTSIPSLHAHSRYHKIVHNGILPGTSSTSMDHPTISHSHI